ncbi:MAG TPA: TonB family protein [Steroidobacteraceae bacterium]|nr:TonB family protein [Steroidobacteraceae bacterium]
MASRALVLREGIAPVRDRLLMTIFVAALLHGMVILGITFSAGVPGKDPAPGLEVLLVSDEVPAADSNPSATYLAQRTQLGSGNTDHSVPPRNRASAQPLVAHEGVLLGTSLRDGAKFQGAADERVLATSAFRPQIQYFGEEGRDAAASDKPLLVPERTSADAGPIDDSGPVELRGPHRDELWVTPDSRESVVAPYLDGWRRRVERIGTLNFPTAARRANVIANPVLEVTLGADGRIVKVLIRRSSGDARLDQAALQVLKLASPFDPFPPELARQYHTLPIVYEYQFVGGRLQGGTLTTVP